MSQFKSMINSFDSWNPLEEVWLGDCYPAHFYDHFDRDVRDTFRVITEWTQEDLGVIEQFLKSRGVTVRRPRYDSDAALYMQDGVLLKPEIMPRDCYATVGNQLWLPWALDRDREAWPWKHVVDEYRQDPHSHVNWYEPKGISIGGAHITRIGRDIMFDVFHGLRGHSDSELKALFQSNIVPHFPDFRCHYIDNGGHMDGCFAVLKPGVIIANRYFDSYDEFFPGWDILTLHDEPEFGQHQGGNYKSWYNGRWWVPGLNLPASFNQYLVDYAPEWVGDYTETYFEVNCLVLDTENVMMLGHNQWAVDQLAKRGITVHSMPFRCRTFWDGGMHCLTVDIRREGSTLEDYLPKSLTA